MHLPRLFEQLKKESGVILHARAREGRGKSGEYYPQNPFLTTYCVWLVKGVMNKFGEKHECARVILIVIGYSNSFKGIF